MDDLFELMDVDKKGMLTKEQAKLFLDQAVPALKASENKQSVNIDKLFLDFDADNNDALDKQEMAALIKDLDFKYRG